MICRPIAQLLGTAISVIAVGPVEAKVDLSVSCMFEHERHGAEISGGLLQLNTVLGGSLTLLRNKGVFRARPMETMLFTRLPAEMMSNALLVIGLGDPEEFTPSILERAVAVAVREAIRLKVESAAFSPDLLDAGIDSALSGVREKAMIKGFTEALRGEHHLFDLGFAANVTLKNWSFGSGLDHFESARAAFSTALSILN